MPKANRGRDPKLPKTKKQAGDSGARQRRLAGKRAMRNMPSGDQVWNGRSGKGSWIGKLFGR